MSGQTRTRLTTIALAMALVIVAGALSACTAPSPTTTAGSGTKTARAGLTAAQSALSTTAPDAKLLVVQNAQAVTPTSTPVWGYLFGSPSTDKTYIVYVDNGKVLQAAPYGTAGLKKADWAKVPTLDQWKIDSDVALTKALAVSGAKSDPAAYFMGFMTFKPASDKTTLAPFVWSVQFDPGASGATTAPIDVNATTGEAKLAK